MLILGHIVSLDPGYFREHAMLVVEKEAPAADTDRKALAGYRLFLPQTDTMLLRFVNGRPVSQVTCDSLAWIADRLAQDGKKALGLIWDNAS